MRKFKVGALFLSSFFASHAQTIRCARTKQMNLLKIYYTDGHIDTWKLSNYEDIPGKNQRL